MRAKGKITDWYDDKGYGFVTAALDGERVFVHIKGFADRRRRPAVGDIVTYSRSIDNRGRPRADAVALSGIPRSTARRSPVAGRLPERLAIGFLVAIAAAALASALPLSVPIIYIVVSLLTFSAYALDKSAAASGAWRTRESTLHLFSLAGGWPGALIAQGRLRHKTRKQPFRAIFWATVVLNGLLLAWLFTAPGAETWHRLSAMILPTG